MKGCAPSFVFKYSTEKIQAEDRGMLVTRTGVSYGSLEGARITESLLALSNTKAAKLWVH